ncbi:MAG: DUF4382 domain-containing protein [Polyangiales bacterium]
MLTDAPIDAERVLVEICGIRVQSRSGVDDAGVDAQEDASAPEASRDNGWLSVSDRCQSLDLLQLRDGLTAELGLSALPAGDYGQIRLEVKQASIVVDGETFAMTIPSGARSGIKIIHGFTVEPAVLTTLALDFDAERSVHHAPGRGYMMSPVIALLGERHEGLAALRAKSSQRPDASAEQGSAGAHARGVAGATSDRSGASAAGAHAAGRGAAANAGAAGAGDHQGKHGSSGAAARPGAAGAGAGRAPSPEMAPDAGNP